jgi:membrane protease YdiL (CAAX protease family)
MVELREQARRAGDPRPPLDDQRFIPESDPEPWLGAVMVFFGTTMAVVIAVAVAAGSAGVSLLSREGFGYVLVGMWAPTMGRLVARWTVDRGRSAPMPLLGPGRLSPLTLGLPLAGAVGVYGAAYLAATVMGEVSWDGAWAADGRVGLNVAFNLPLAMLLGLPGAIGEELGWRGWLQPRLDRAGIRGSLPIVIVLETIFHVPIMVALGYGSDGGLVTGILLFGLLKLGATPVWTWAVYRQRSVWAAIWFHAAHNAVAQVIVPKLFIVTGSAWMVGETGVLPIIAYLAAALAVLGLMWFRGGSWNAFANWSLERE